MTLIISKLYEWKKYGTDQTMKSIVIFKCNDNNMDSLPFSIQYFFFYDLYEV